MNTIPRFLAALALCALPLLCSAEPPEQQWFTVLIDGRKVGSFKSTRTVEDGLVVTTQAMDVTLDRAGSKVRLSSSESATETTSGVPVAFGSRSMLSGSETTIGGTIAAGSMNVTTQALGERSRRQLPWPHGALLPEGLRLVAIRAGLAPGTRYGELTFQPSSLDAVDATSVVGPQEDLDLPAGRRRLSRVDQTIDLPGAAMTSRAWVDADQTIYKLTMPLMGVELTLLACDKACATAPNQGSDVFTHTLIRAPHALKSADLAGSMRYIMLPRDHAIALNLPQTDEQQVTREGKATVVTVGPAHGASSSAQPVPDDYRPNDWLQSDAPLIVDLAKRAVGNASTPLQRMQRIETFVRTYISTKSLDVGYASALEVARKPEGDCTEHAVLVAALGRAAGIATRVVDGLAYAPNFAGKQQVFVPHAWVQAFVDGHWQSFDAALNGFDAGHIALAVGNGDPWRFYTGLDLLGRIDLYRAEPVAKDAGQD